MKFKTKESEKRYNVIYNALDLFIWEYSESCYLENPKMQKEAFQGLIDDLNKSPLIKPFHRVTPKLEHYMYNLFTKYNYDAYKLYYKIEPMMKMLGYNFDFKQNKKHLISSEL